MTSNENSVEALRLERHEYNKNPIFDYFEGFKEGLAVVNIKE